MVNFRHCCRINKPVCRGGFHPVLPTPDRDCFSLIIFIFRNSETADKEIVRGNSGRCRAERAASSLLRGCNIQVRELFTRFNQEGWNISFNSDRTSEGGGRGGGAEECHRWSVTSSQLHVLSRFFSPILWCGSTRHHPGLRSVLPKTSNVYIWTWSFTNNPTSDPCLLSHFLSDKLIQELRNKQQRCSKQWAGEHSEAFKRRGRWLLFS